MRDDGGDRQRQPILDHGNERVRHASPFHDAGPPPPPRLRAEKSGRRASEDAGNRRAAAAPADDRANDAAKHGPAHERAGFQAAGRDRQFIADQLAGNGQAKRD